MADKTLAELEQELDAKEGDDKEAVLDDFEVVIADEDDDKEDLDRQQEEDDDTPLIAAEEDGEEVDTETLTGKPVDVKRIKREIRLKEAAREEARVAEARAKASDQVAQAAVTAKIAAEKALVEVLGTSIDQNIQTTTDALIAAEEAGETKTKVELQGKLDDLRAKKREVDAAKDRLKTQAEDFERSKAKPSNEPTAEAKGWMARNRWIGDPDYKAVRAAQIEIDRELLASGRFDPNTKAYFDEMDRRLHREMPTLRTRAVKAGLLVVDKAKPRQPTGGGVGAVSRGTIPGSKTRVVLDQGDFKQMRAYGMDPQKPADRMQWAKTKWELANA